MKIAEIIGRESDWPDEIAQERPAIRKSPEEIGATAHRVRNAALEKPLVTPAQWKAGQTERLVALGQRLAAQMAEH